MADPISATLQLPFPEQIAAFRARLGNLVPTARWDDLAGAEHDRAAMVAGATKADLLSDIMSAVDSAIADGTGLDAFAKRWRQTVAERGWHGWTGEGTARGEAWRIRIVYQTNMATSFAAGRLAQLKEGGYPLWVYRHGNSREPRLQHLAWNGLTLPADHPFWASHAPPNGWGCSCYIAGARTEAGARRVGGDPTKPYDPAWDTIDPRTGAPVGIGKGWGHAPGATVVDTVLSLRDKLDRLPPQPSIDLIQSWLELDVFETWLKAPQGAWPLLRLPADDAARIGSDRTVADLTAAMVRQQLVQQPGISAADYALAQQVVSNPTATARIGDGAMVYLARIATDDVLAVEVTASAEGLQVSRIWRLPLVEAARDPVLGPMLGRTE